MAYMLYTLYFERLFFIYVIASVFISFLYINIPLFRKVPKKNIKNIFYCIYAPRIK